MQLWIGAILAAWFLLVGLLVDAQVGSQQIVASCDADYSWVSAQRLCEISNTV